MKDKVINDSILELLPDKCCDGFSVYGHRKKSTHEEMFDSLDNKKDRGKLCAITLGAGKDKEKAIRNFVDKHKKLFVCMEWYFLLLKCGNKFFVARVYVHDDGLLRVLVYRFEDVIVWSVLYGHRVVVPQSAVSFL